MSRDFTNYKVEGFRKAFKEESLLNNLKKILYLLIAFPLLAFGQLPNGSTAPDFTITDIDGSTHNLYDILDEGKPVLLDLFAVWFGPSWSFAESGVLNEFNSLYGANGDNSVFTISIESDVSTPASELSGSGSSVGDWTSLIGHLLADDEDASIANDYDITYYPTIYLICPDRTVTEIGQGSGANYWTVETLAEEVFINICPQLVEGCSNPIADNYNSLATIDDGSCVFPELNVSIPLYLPEGWSIFGFTCIEPMDATNAFEPIIESAVIVKDGEGNAYLTEWNFNGIGDLEYAKGYQIKMSEEVIDFQFCSIMNPLGLTQADLDLAIAEALTPQGCTDVSANNYNPEAIENDGSCYYDYCLDYLACNYGVDGELCSYGELGYDCLGEFSGYVVGMEAEGGIVFYVDQTGEHGLVAAVADLDQNYEWGCYLTPVDGAYGTAIGTGYQNTLDIVNQGCEAENGNITAAQATLNYEIEGFEDWYLPSLHELYLMDFNIGIRSSLNNIGDFQFVYYFSSSSMNNGNNDGAQTVKFGVGANGHSRISLYNIRAIRSF